MAYPTMAIANAFIQRAKKGKIPDLSPMKLQKLLFFAQSWYLKQRKEPLIDDVFFRWQYGPVIPALYHEFKTYESDAIDRFGTFVSPRGAMVPFVPEEDVDTWQFIDAVIKAYGKFTGPQLSGHTHREGSAWQITGGADGGPIPNKMLIEGIC